MGQIEMIQGFLRVRNLDHYQNYQDKAPPWVKLYTAVLDDWEFSTLSDPAKWQACASLLMASRTHNHLPLDPSWLKAKTMSNAPFDVNSLIAIGFLEICDCDDCEASGATAKYREEYAGVCVRQKKKKAADEITVKQVNAVFKRHLEAREKFYKRKGQPYRPPSITPTIRKAIRTAIAEFGEEKAMDAAVGIFYSEFHTGKNSDEKEFLNPLLCWREANIETFSELYHKEAIAHGAR